ncbi:hypothetical protein SSYRP_v1c03960 [Spiroplasma syrphidicola EA-1]|uniref:Transmembrane protein n=2 Tax=Spiroplasma syrphidicola TaxID=216945 RepID=R4UIJ1_9MOLU|nr:hypothetical protein SSYRP_v1c03960 [Spiroplasma syrphidicola EA-1]
MKVIDNKNKVENSENSHISPVVQHELDFQATRTVFWKSVLFLIIEGVAPFLVLFLLSSPDLKFAHHYEVGVGIGFGLAYIIGVFFLTLLGFIVKGHQADQFIYTTILAWTLYGLYLTGYWWTWDDILYRCLVAFGFLLVSAFFGTFLSVWIRNISGVINLKKIAKNNKQEG